MEYSNDNLFGSEMMIYTTEDGLTKIETTFDGDTVQNLQQLLRTGKPIRLNTTILM